MMVNILILIIKTLSNKQNISLDFDYISANMTLLPESFKNVTAYNLRSIHFQDMIFSCIVFMDLFIELELFIDFEF